MKENNPRDYVGYGRNNIPNANWPNKSKIAVQFVLNYEEGGENCILHGDPHSETFLSEIANAEAYPNRHMSMESIYEYGSRVGVWRVLDEFERRKLPLTVFAIATALQRNPDVAKAIVENGHEIACHGLKWIHYQHMPIEQERAHMVNALGIIEDITGKRPIGWYTGRDSPNTRQLVSEQDGLIYDSDYYGDDLPFWILVKNGLSDKNTRPHLVIPYALDTNDMRFSSPFGFSHGEEFFQYLKDHFDCLYSEGEQKPKMMSVGLHCRIIGRPSRFIALKRFLDYVQSHPKVWVATREEIARHWIKYHSPIADNSAVKI